MVTDGDGTRKRVGRVGIVYRVGPEGVDVIIKNIYIYICGN